MAWYDKGSQKSALKEYKSRKEMERDSAKALAAGWQIVSVNEMSQRTGILRVFALGPFALFFKPKSRVMVAYTHS